MNDKHVLVHTKDKCNDVKGNLVQYCVNVIFSMKPHCFYIINHKSMKAYTINGKDRAISTVFPFIYNSTCSSNTLYKSLLLLILAPMELNHFKSKIQYHKIYLQ